MKAEYICVVSFVLITDFGGIRTTNRLIAARASTTTRVGIRSTATSVARSATGNSGTWLWAARGSGSTGGGSTTATGGTGGITTTTRRRIE